MSAEAVVDELIESLRVDQLRTIARNHGVPATGRKAELVARLRDVLLSAAEPQRPATPAGPAALPYLVLALLVAVVALSVVFSRTDSATPEVDRFGNTYLHHWCAAGGGRAVVNETLLRHDARQNALNETAFLLCCRFGPAALVARLVEHHSPLWVHADVTCRYPLHYVLERGVGVGEATLLSAIDAMPWPAVASSCGPPTLLHIVAQGRLPEAVAKAILLGILRHRQEPPLLSLPPSAAPPLSATMVSHIRFQMCNSAWNSTTTALFVEVMQQFARHDGLWAAQGLPCCGCDTGAACSDGSDSCLRAAAMCAAPTGLFAFLRSRCEPPPHFAHLLLRDLAYVAAMNWSEAASAVAGNLLSVDVVDSAPPSTSALAQALCRSLLTHDSPCIVVGSMMVRAIALLAVEKNGALPRIRVACDGVLDSARYSIWTPECLGDHKYDVGVEDRVLSLPARATWSATSWSEQDSSSTALQVSRVGFIVSRSATEDL